MDKIDLQTFADESKADCIEPWSIGLVLYSAIRLRCICADPQLSLWNSLNRKKRHYPNYPCSVDVKSSRTDCWYSGANKQTNKLTKELTNQPMNHTINQPTSQPTDTQQAIPCRTIHFEMLLVRQILNKFPRCIQPNPLSQAPLICLYTDPDESNPHSTILFL